MAKDMLGQAVRKIVDLPNDRLGVICDLAEKLGGDSGQEWFTEEKKFLRKKKCWTGIIADTILEFIGAVNIPAREKFIAKDNFFVDTSEKARVKISYLGDNFRANFLNKIEEPIVETALCYHKLKKSSRDIPIINELGGENRAETSLSTMFFLIEKQRNGESGALLTNGYANIFYLRNVAGVLWAVRCYWSGGGWRVYAYSVGDPSAWGGGCRVFSRNS
ncbi:MAG: hypothetical protein V3T98_00625 [Candidatus Paceibacterota bacterium]